ncbi:pentapeptide repeat-containing protein [uncultured Roseivirga sp.]|uniref:pentapeptide repeat-containing protein n=1 Tax=uncultured Roseivirga sp. TaxID=543088 RepID=UPI0030DBE74F|tara:strand:+ start:113861 stop:114751 length:891 start_codon:yes stop_codon:yes gene_type:complete
METKMIGSKIAEARKKLNISQAQLAERLFISAQAVGKWERGESIPDIITFNRLAKIIGVDLNYFSEDFPSSISKTEPEELSEKERSSAINTEKRPSWNMSRGNWVDADFSGLKNLHEKFSSSNMQRCLFAGSDLSGLLLKGNHVDGCDFSNSDLSNSYVQKSFLVSNNFQNSVLKGAEFTECHVKNCDFSSADFSGAIIKSCDFTKNTIQNAVWKNTSFVDTNFTNLVFDGVLKDCSFENTAFSKVTFQNATLYNTFFKCRSMKRIKFIDCKADRMTYEFLKNGKADLSGITLVTT